MNNMVEQAKQCGFHKAALVETRDIPFEPSFRKYCEENYCGKYGVNYSCPPTCGSTDFMEAKIKALPHALVLQSRWEIDYHDGAAIKHGKAVHNRLTRELIADFQPETRGFMVGASGCSLCSPCAMVEGKPCRFPDKAASCTSAYCIYVKKLADQTGLDYDSGPGIINFFSLYVFEEA